MYSQTKFFIMRKSIRFSILFFVAVFSSLLVFPQAVIISGKIRNSTTQEDVQAVSVVVKGSPLGTFTDANGNFKIQVAQLPVTLVVSSVGFETKEIPVESANADVEINVITASSLGHEVVVAATR